MFWRSRDPMTTIRMINGVGHLKGIIQGRLLPHRTGVCVCCGRVPKAWGRRSESDELTSWIIHGWYGWRLCKLLDTFLKRHRSWLTLVLRTQQLRHATVQTSPRFVPRLTCREMTHQPWAGSVWTRGVYLMGAVSGPCTVCGRGFTG